MDLISTILYTDMQQNDQEIQNSLTLEVQLPPQSKLTLLIFQEQKD